MQVVLKCNLITACLKGVIISNRLVSKDRYCEPLQEILHWRANWLIKINTKYLHFGRNKIPTRHLSNGYNS